MSFLWPLPLRIKIGGTVLIVVGLILYFWRSFETIMLAISAIGIVLVLVGFILKPKEKTASA
jgi:drug/metabolite transporter (DMT)-like permease